MSSPGSPISPAITVIGSGTATSRIQSAELQRAPPRGRIAATSDSASARIAGSSAATRRIENARFESLRWRACAGGSAIASASTWPVPPPSSASSSGRPGCSRPCISTATSFDE
jgi:hypothetical protein